MFALTPDQRLYRWLDWMRYFGEITESMTRGNIAWALESVLDSIREAMDADSCTLIWLVDGKLQVTHESLRDGDSASMIGTFVPPSPFIQKVLASEGAFSAAEASLSDGRWSAGRSDVYCRLRFNTQVVGLISVHRTARPSWDSDERALLSLLSGYVGLYLYSLRLGETLERHMQSLLVQFQAALRTPEHGLNLQAFVGEIRNQAGANSIECLTARFPSLSAREAEILSRLDRPNKDIAKLLFVSESTIKGHVGKILEKFGGVSRQEAYRLAKQAVASKPATAA